MMLLVPVILLFIGAKLVLHIRAHAGSLRGPAAESDERFSAIPQVRAR